MEYTRQEFNAMLNEVFNKIRKEAQLANAKGGLDAYLDKFGIDTMTTEVQEKRGKKILVVGVNTGIRVKDIKGLFKKYGVAERLETLEYDESTNYNFHDLAYSDAYLCVMFGPVPHSTVGRKSSSSIVEEMEAQTEMYPKIIRLTDTNGNLKMTKNNLRKALESLDLHEIIEC